MLTSKNPQVPMKNSPTLTPTLTRTILVLFAVAFLLPMLGSAQWKQSYHDGTADWDHNHYSVESWHDGSVVAGTLFDQDAPFEPGNSPQSMIHAMELDLQGNIVWENTFDFGQEDRCFDVCVINEELIAITGSVDKNIFVAIIDNSGNLVQTRHYASPDGLHSVGLSIIYSQTKEMLFVGGFGAEDIYSFVNTPKQVNSIKTSKGILFGLDISLNLIWNNQIDYKSQVAMVGNITEIEGFGIYATGKVANYDPVEIENYDGVLSLGYDYDGNQIWDKSFSRLIPGTNGYGDPVIKGGGIMTGVDAVYDAETEELFVLINYDPEHSFGIQKISSPTSSTPTVQYTNTNDLLSELDMGNYAGFDIEFDPADNQLLVGGLTWYQRPLAGNTAPTPNSPSFIAKVDRANADVLDMKLQEAYNENYRIHDHEIFQAFWSTHPYINHPDIFTIVDQDVFQVLGYQSNQNAYGLSVATTDASRSVPNSIECERVAGGNNIVIDFVQFVSVESNSHELHSDEFETGPENRQHYYYADCSGESNRIATNGQVIQETEIATAVSIFPNPASEALTVQFSEEISAGSVRLFTLTGQEVMHIDFIQSSSLQLDVSKLSAGSYLIQTDGDTKVFRQLIVVD